MTQAELLPRDTHVHISDHSEEKKKVTFLQTKAVWVVGHRVEKKAKLQSLPISFEVLGNHQMVA